MAPQTRNGEGGTSVPAPLGNGEVPRRREPVLNLPPAVVALILLMAGLHLLRAQVLDPAQDFALLVRAAFVPAFYSGALAWDFWSFSAPFTYAFLHGDVVHLGVNVVWLAAFGPPLANRLGVPRFLLFWAVTGLAAASLHFVLHPFSDAPLIGASGAISGMMGAATRFGFRSERRERGAVFAGPPLAVRDTFRSRGVLAFLLVWMGVNALTGLAGSLPGVSGQIAWEAHVGGFLAGFLGLGMFLPPAARQA